VNVKINTFIQ